MQKPVSYLEPLLHLHIQCLYTFSKSIAIASFWAEWVNDLEQQKLSTLSDGQNSLWEVTSSLFRPSAWELIKLPNIAINYVTLVF